MFGIRQGDAVQGPPLCFITFVYNMFKNIFKDLAIIIYYIIVCQFLKQKSFYKKSHHIFSYITVIGSFFPNPYYITLKVYKDLKNQYFDLPTNVWKSWQTFYYTVLFRFSLSLYHKRINKINYHQPSHPPLCFSLLIIYKRTITP